MDFHYINTNEAYGRERAYKTWLNLGYAFTNGQLKYGNKLGNMNPADLVFMYVKKKGIKAVGRVITEWDGIEYHEPIIPAPKVDNEFRIQVNWFIVIPNGFVSPAKVKEILGYPFYSSGACARIKKKDKAENLLRHILRMLD